MLVPFRAGGLEHVDGEVTPVMEAAATQEVRDISRDVGRAAARVSKFLDAHPLGRCRCVFCARHPHAVEFLNVLFVSLEMHADFFDDCRPPTAGEMRELRDDCPPAVVRGG